MMFTLRNYASHWKYPLLKRDGIIMKLHNCWIVENIHDRKHSAWIQMLVHAVDCSCNCQKQELSVIITRVHIRKWRPKLINICMICSSYQQQTVDTIFQDASITSRSFRIFLLPNRDSLEAMIIFAFYIIRISMQKRSFWLVRIQLSILTWLHKSIQK